MQDSLGYVACFVFLEASTVQNTINVRSYLCCDGSFLLSMMSFACLQVDAILREAEVDDKGLA